MRLRPSGKHVAGLLAAAALAGAALVVQSARAAERKVLLENFTMLS